VTRGWDSPCVVEVTQQSHATTPSQTIFEAGCRGPVRGLRHEVLRAAMPPINALLEPG
jgi:hypothetical protein